MSGAIFLIDHGMWPLALVVFVASVLVPLTKLLILVYLLISVQMRSTYPFRSGAGGRDWTRTLPGVSQPTTGRVPCRSQPASGGRVSSLGGSLEDDFLRVLGENLGQLLRTSRILVEPAEARFALDYRVVADVLSFEGTPGGEAVFKVRWSVLDPQMDQALTVRENTYRSSARSADPEAMIAALREALSVFSRDIAEQLRRLPKTKPVAASAEIL